MLFGLNVIASIYMRFHYETPMVFAIKHLIKDMFEGEEKHGQRYVPARGTTDRREG